MEKRIILCLRVGTFANSQNSQSLTSSGRLAEACLRFTPRVALRRDGSGVFLDLQPPASSGAFSPESILKRTLVTAQRLGLPVQAAGWGSTAREAWARARLPDVASSPSPSPNPNPRPALAAAGTLPLEVLEHWADPFGLREAEDPRALLPFRAAAQDLKQLGLRSVEELLKIPVREIASRFGKALSRLSVDFWRDPTWPRFAPEPRVIETRQVDDEVILGGLDFILKLLGDRTLTRLRGRGLRASKVAIHLKQERWSTVREPRRTIDFVLPMPQSTTSGLLPLLLEKLDHELQARPLESPLQEIALEIVETLPGLGSQRDFFNRREEQREAWNALLGRLIQKLGQERVFRARVEARYLPERAWSKSLEESPPLHAGARAGPLGAPERPARVLKRPEPVERVAPDVVAPLSGRRWETTLWEGPERLSGDWWNDPEGLGFDRDYYRVKTVTGEKLWVFVNRKAKAGFKAGSYFLHGYFD